MQTSTLEEEGIATAEQGAAARRIIVDERRAVAGYKLTGSTAISGAAAAGLTKPTFVRVTFRELQEGRMDELDPKRDVLEIMDGAGDEISCDVPNLSILRSARGKGFKLAFDARLLKKEYAAFVPLASYVVLDMGVLELDRAAALARGVQAGTKAAALATKVRTSAEFGHLASVGVKLFEGDWFMEPPEKPDPSIRLSYASLIKLLNMVVREAEVNEIEDLLKHEPTISFRLLRYINSAGFGSQVEITSFRHAVMTVGLKRLFRWTALLLTQTPTGTVAPAVGSLAIVRGRMMEILARDALSPSDADMAFVTGMFSLLDLLLAMSMVDAMAMVNLPSAVGDAILAGDGPYARYLAMAKACETADEGLIEIMSERYGVPADQMIAAHLEALAWAEQFS